MPGWVRYPELGKCAHAAIPGSTLIEFLALDHAPQMQNPTAFHKALLGWRAAPERPSRAISLSLPLDQALSAAISSRSCAVIS